MPTIVTQLVAIVGIVVAVIAGGGRYQRLVWAVLAGAIVVSLAGALAGHAIVGSIAEAIAAWSLAGVAAVTRRSPAWWFRGAERPLALQAPFEGEWRVAAGGPSPSDNHHLVAAAQLYAYDFVREDREAYGSAIVAPVSGTVVAIRDGMLDRTPRGRVYEELLSPFGNYVAIASGSAFVYLAHLQRGSVCVARGDRVDVGQLVGFCGNSGRTTRPHLHIHAQDRAGEHALFARAIAIAIGDATGPPRLLDMDDRLRS